MSQRVIAISNQVVQCGKRVSDSKKKFVWRFRIGDTTYDLQLVSSALSGKRIVSLNDKSIFSEQNVLNINFDFNHNIQGHSLRIFKQQEGIHNYNLRIDNRSFQYLLKKGTSGTTQTKVTGKYEASNSDPFSEFQKVASNTNKDADNNNFGSFDDFANFQWSKQQKRPAQTQKKTQSTNKSFDFDFQQKKQSTIKAQNFQTNNINSFQKNFNNIDLLSSDQFTTNNYGNYNNYLDLIDSKQSKSDAWGVPVDPNSVSILDKIKPDLSGKQMKNKTLMTAVEIKKKAVNQFQSLI